MNDCYLCMDTLPAVEAVASPTLSVPTVGDSVPAAPAGLRGSDIVGLKYFDQLLKRLRGDGCGRDKAGYRELHFDQSAALVLLY